MYRKSGLCLSRGLILAVLALFLLTFGCYRPTPNVPTEGTIQTNPAPFQTSRTSTAGSSPQTLSTNTAPDRSPPFQNSEVLPAGTLLYVSLRVPLVAGSGSKESFEAALDEPVIVEGNSVIARDAMVSGKIESAHTSNVRPDRDYVQLTLISVQAAGFTVPIQTASLFARRLRSAEADSGTIRLEKGRRLTFRLKEPVFLRLNGQQSVQ